SCDNLIGHKLSDFLKITNEEKYDFITSIIKSGYKQSEYEINNVQLISGKKIYISGYYVGIIEDDKLVRMWVVLRDITEKTIIKKELEESKQRYKMLTDEVPNIIWTSKPNGNLD